jgi:WD40 repeat protein
VSLFRRSTARQILRSISAPRLRAACVEPLENRLLLSGDYTYAFQIGSPAVGQTPNNDLANAVTVDRYGNTFVVGGFAGTVDFNPSSRKTFNLTSSGLTDVFVVKFGPDGGFLWARQAGGVDEDLASAVVTDRHGNVIIAGGFTDEADFRPGKKFAILGSRGGLDAFVWELDADGNLLNAIRAGSPGTDAVNSIALDPSGNILISGIFAEQADFANTDLGTNGGQDAFIAKITPAFSLTFAVNVGGIGDDTGAGITTDAQGNIYEVGSFASTADLDPGPGTHDVVSKGGTDGYVLKLGPQGGFLSAAQLGGTGDDDATAIVIDRGGNEIVAGNFTGTADLDPNAGTTNLTSAGNSDVYVAKYNTSGNIVWARKAGGASADAVRSITVDKPGNVYLTGQYAGTADFDPGPSVFNLVGTGTLANAFVWKVSSAGDFIYARDFHTASGFAEGACIALDATGELFVAGKFSGTVDFNPGRKISDRITSSDTSYDAFLAKLTP